MNRDWRTIAADMLDARKAHIDGESSEEEVAAMAFLFDNGILYLSEDGRKEIAAELRRAALTPETNHDRS